MHCSLFIHCKHTRCIASAHTHTHTRALVSFSIMALCTFLCVWISAAVDSLPSLYICVCVSVYQGLYREAYSLVQPSVDDRVCLHSQRPEESREEGSVGKIITRRVWMHVVPLRTQLLPWIGRETIAPIVNLRAFLLLWLQQYLCIRRVTPDFAILSIQALSVTLPSWNRGQRG